MGAGREEVKIENEVLEKKGKGSLKKSVIVTVEPEDRYHSLSLREYICILSVNGEERGNIGSYDSCRCVYENVTHQIWDYSTFVSGILVWFSFLIR